MGSIKDGEPQQVEFKEFLPENSEKYTKTVIAFANSQGGKLIFGVEDQTGKVVGIDRNTLFQTMDSLSNAISDSCMPQIVPVIEPYTLDGKTVILVTVEAQPHRPYYLKSLGKEKGTYIRVGGTSRHASPEKIMDLEMEGARVSWDELACVGYKVTEEAIDQLCRTVTLKRQEETSGLHSHAQPDVTKVNLENWNLLIRNGKELLASNAFVLLTSDYFPFSKIQCAVFKGKDRSIFLEKREYAGPLYKQIEEAIDFVLRNIRLGVKIEGATREEAFELPLEAIREMIVNAICHRDYREESCVQVSIYDDRLEVLSPGGLYNGLSIEEAMQGHSRIRNRAIANTLNQMRFMEGWGTGLGRIQKSARNYGLPDVEFVEMPSAFKVNLYRKFDSLENRTDVGEKVHIVGEKPHGVGENEVDVGENGVDVGENGADVGENEADVGENDHDVEESRFHLLSERILAILEENKEISAAGIGHTLHVSQRTVERYIRQLRKEGILVHHGSAKGGFWEIVK